MQVETFCRIRRKSDGQFWDENVCRFFPNGGWFYDREYVRQNVVTFPKGMVEVVEYVPHEVGVVE